MGLDGLDSPFRCRIFCGLGFLSVKWQLKRPFIKQFDFDATSIQKQSKNVTDFYNILLEL